MINIIQISFLQKIISYYNKVIFLITFAKIRSVKFKFILFFFLASINFLFDMLSLFSIFPLIILVLDKDKFINYLQQFEFFYFINNISFNNLIIFLSIFIFFLSLAKLSIISFFSFYRANLFMQIQLKLSRYLLDLYLKNPYRIIINKTHGRMITNIKNECERINFSFRSLTELLFEILILSVIIIAILFLNLKVSLVFIFFLFLLSILFSKANKKINHNIGSLRSKHVSILTRHLLESFNGIKTIKVLNSENKIIDTFSKRDDNIAKIDVKFFTFQSLPRLFFEFILIATLLAVVVLTLELDRKNDVLPILTFVGLCSFRIFPCLSRIHVNLQSVKFSYNSISNIFNEINEGQTKNNSNDFIKIEKLNENELLRVKSITFAHEKDLKILFEKVNLSVRNNEKIAIIGETGSGKTTILDIILGLQEPSSGNVIIDSFNLSSLSNLSNFYSYVPQLPFLIDGTIYENVVYGKNNLSELTREDISLVLEKTCCKEFVEKLDDGINTQVGENGIKLSLGQRQRINLARALHKNSKLLIMDEPTSALDPEVEKKIILNLCDSYNKLSFIMVTHKHDILENFDSIYKFENRYLKKIK